MSRSGVGLAKDCVPAFEDLKLGKKVKYIIYRISDDRKNIEVEKTNEDSDYNTFLEDLPEKSCRYAIYDFAFQLEQGEGMRNKICFFSWAPDNAAIRDKMVYASSKDALRRSLTGIHAEIQGTDLSEVAHETVLEKFCKK